MKTSKTWPLTRLSGPLLGWLLCSSLVFTIGSAWGQELTYKSLSVDGRLESPIDQFHADKKSGFLIALSEDSAFLYVELIVQPVVLQNQILISGLTLWLESKGNKSTPKGIRYPMGLPEDRRPRDPNLLQYYLDQMQADKAAIPTQANSMELIGFYGSKDDVTWGGNLNPGGISIAIGFEANGDLIYEAAFPKSLVETSAAVRLKLETGALGRPKLHGDDAVGLSGGSISNPSQTETQSQRAYQRKLELYRLYTVPAKWKSKNLTLRE